MDCICFHNSTVISVRLYLFMFSPQYTIVIIRLLTEDCAQRFSAMPVPAVIHILVFVVLLSVPQLAVHSCFNTVFHELRDWFPGTGSGCHPCYWCYLPTATPVSFRGPHFPQSSIFLAICLSSIMMLPFYTLSEISTKFGMVSKVNVYLGTIFKPIKVIVN